MSATNDSNAGGSLAGFIYQIYYFLYRLLTLQPGEIVSLEKIDDVGVEKDDNRTYYQLKHSINSKPSTIKRMNNRDSDLWKTLSLWVNIIKKQGNKNAQKEWINQSEFVLISNKTTENNKLSQLIDACFQDDGNWTELETFLSEQAAKEPKKKKDDKKNVFYYTKNVNDFALKKEFFKNVRTELETDEEIKAKIDYVLKNLKHVPCAHAGSLREWIMGRLVGEINQKETQYDVVSFNATYGSLIRKMQSRKFVPLYRKYEIPENPQEQTFIQQLKGIGDPHVQSVDDIVKLTNQKLCFENDYNEANKAAGAEDQRAFEMEVYSRWDNAFVENNVDISELSSVEEIQAAGRTVLKDVKKAPLKYDQDDIGTYDTFGCFYHFSDGESPRIGWRYDWKELYNGQEWIIE